jgi:hypothetical protein
MLFVKKFVSVCDKISLLYMIDFVLCLGRLTNFLSFYMIDDKGALSSYVYMDRLDAKQVPLRFALATKVNTTFLI